MSERTFQPSAAAEELLRRWIGLDPHTIGEAAIRRAVRLRMLSLGIDDVPSFIRLVEADQGERDRLVEEVVVAESWFFRDPQVYDHLRRFATARVATLAAGEPLRILSAPCAAGEEPYSIAMTLLEAGLPPERFRIDAIDVSRVALARAHAARYSPNAFRNAEAAYRDRWFRPEGGGSVLDDAVRGCVNFAWANVLEESFVSEALDSGRAPYDVIFCRNLLIYLTPNARSAVERSIDRLLKEDGVVVVGAAEPAILRARWAPDSATSMFSLRRAKIATNATSTPPLPRPPSGRGTPVRAATPASRAPSPGARSAPPQAGPAGLSAPETPPDAAAAPPPGTASGSDDGQAAAAESLALPEVLERANALANARRFRDAIALCESHLASLGPSAELFFMTGIVQQSCGDLAAAEDSFQKTLYLDAGHEDALLALSLLADQRGDAALAAQYRRSALRSVERRGAS